MCRFGGRLTTSRAACLRTRHDSMLRAGLIGFPSSGKTALFQLMTSAREAPRGGGKTDANVGVSRVPDERLDRLTALFNPRKHVPATVEFADIAGAGGGQVGRAGAARRRTLPQRQRPAARRPHVRGSVGPASGGVRRSGARRQDDGGRTHPGGPRGGREAARAARARPQEGQRRGVAPRAGDPARLPDGARGRDGRSAPWPCRQTMPGGCADSSSSRPNRCSWSSIWTRPICRRPTAR